MKDYVHRIIKIFSALSLPNKKMVQEIHQWLVDEGHAQEKEDALQQLWDEIDATPESDIQASLKSIYKKAGVSTSKRSFHLRKIHYVAAAAVAVILLSVGSTYYLTKQTYSEIDMVENFTAIGKTNKIVLPDGSIAETNSHTILFYPKTFSGNTRTVHLIGEANFKVKHNPNKPFIVRSNSLSVTALGTEFNVMAYPDDNQIVATLIHGKIKVDCNDGQASHVLYPGQQITFIHTNGEIRLNNADLEDVTAWQKGFMVFKSMTIKEILFQIERKCNVNFQYPPNVFTEDKFNFKFDVKSNIHDIMDVLKIVVGGFDYHVDGHICLIKPLKK